MFYSKFAKSIFGFAKLITVEPIGFLNFLAFFIFTLTLQTGIYDVICYQQFSNQTIVDCRNIRMYKNVEDVVQKTASQWNILFSVAHFLPAIIAHVLFGSWGDKSGRKINILIGLTGMIINVFPLTVIFEYKHVSLWYLVLSSFVSGTTGYLGIIMISCYAYLADFVENREALTTRMVFLSLMISLAGIAGPVIVAAMLDSVRLSYIMLFVEFVLFAAFVYTMIRLRQISPKELKKEKASSQTSPDAIVSCASVAQSSCRSLPVKRSCGKECCSTMSTAKQLLVDVCKTYSRKRLGRRRAYLCIASLAYLLQLFAEMGLRGNVTSLFVFRRPLKWTGSMLAYWKASSNLLNCVGNLLGVFLFKKLFGFSETTIMLISLVSGFFELLITGLSTTTWMMYTAAAIGSFNLLFVPTVKSFTSQIVDRNEVGKSYTAYGLAADLGYGVSNMIANAIYGATLKFFPGFIFILGAFLYAVSFGLVLWIHFDFRHEIVLTSTEGVLASNDENSLTQSNCTISTCVNGKIDSSV